MHTVAIDQFLFLSAVQNYWVTGKNRNCPTNVITGEKSWCSEAANDFGVEFQPVTLGWNDMPAGCFFDHWNNLLRFNEITDPNEITLDTSDNTYGKSGVCRSGIVVL